MKIKRFLKRICRNVLREEINQRELLIKRLQGYARPYAPELKSDGSDQTYNLRYRLDVGLTYIPKGTFNISSPMNIEGLNMRGDK